MKGIEMNKKDVAIIAGPFVGLVAYAAVNITVVKVKEIRAKRAAKKAELTVVPNNTSN